MTLSFFYNIKVNEEEKKMMIDDDCGWLLRKHMCVYTRLVTIKTLHTVT
jgi:hypothetical protein